MKTMIVLLMLSAVVVCGAILAFGLVTITGTKTSSEPRYISTDLEQCRSALFICPQSEPFFDESGCGCL